MTEPRSPPPAPDRYVAEHHEPSWREGLKVGTPTLFGIGAWGLVVGIAMVKSGLSVPQALGMTYPQTMGYIVLPQAFRNMVPVLLTQTIILFQDTSLVYAIGAYDLLKGFVTAGKIYGRPEEAYLLAAVVYFIICFSLSYAVKQLQNRIAIIR